MTYTVSQFDTIPDLAQKFGVSEEDLKAYNNLSSSSFLRPGMIIIIPPARPFPPRPVPPRPRPPMNRTYIVRRGDTIWSIARMFGVSAQNIMFANNMTFPIVVPGQRLIIPMGNRPF